MIEQMLHIVAIVLMAAFGALARSLSRNKRAVRVFIIIAESVIAMFGGLLVHFLAEYMQMDTNLAFILAGVSGWTSPQLIDAIASVTTKKTGLDVKEGETNGKD